jgi:hypothetical protein
MPQAKMPARVGDESEDQLIDTAIEAVSHCRWVVGECAAKWTQRYARGRTDADFGALIGVSADQVFQRRRVWETFGAVRGDFRSLKWSHFHAALNWDDALDCLRWADEMQATVAEMRAWRRAQRGEDLTVEAAAEEPVRYLPSGLESVQDPSQFAEGLRQGAARSGGSEPQSDRAALTGVARQAGDDEDYAPFRSDAGSPAPAKGHPERGAPPAEAPSPEQLIKRMTSSFERFAKVLSPGFRKEFRRLPEPIRAKFFEAARELAEAVSHLR